MVFLGEARLSMDPKNRLTIPAKWRSEQPLTELYLVMSLGRGCLAALTPAGLEKAAEKAFSQAANLEAHEIFKNQFFSTAALCPLDAQGRILLSDEFRKFAVIEKEVVLTGGGTKFDIWNPKAWQQWKAVNLPTYQTILKSIGL